MTTLTLDNYYRICLVLAFLGAPIIIFAQENMTIEGAIQLSSSQANSPEPGTIQWNGQDFLGWDGQGWHSLTNQIGQGSVGVNQLLDIDGNLYETVVIGPQEWMAENLRTTRYRNGGLIPYIGLTEVWIQLDTREEPGYTWYNFEEDHKFPYGGLYNWYSVSTGELCPTGWHVPSLAAWDSLITYLLGQPVAGGALKATGTLSGQDGLWQTPNQGASNSSGFSGIPGGSYFVSFFGKGNQGVFWTSTEFNLNQSWSKSLFYDVGSTADEESSKYGGLSIRCIKN